MALTSSKAPAAGSQPIAEQELAATSLGLLAQPGLWPALKLPPAAPNAQAP